MKESEGSAWLSCTQPAAMAEELEIQRLKKTNEKLQHELQKSEVSGSSSSQDGASTVDFA